MSKIEEKLSKLGYKYYDDLMSVYVFVKKYNKWNLTIETRPHEDKILDWYIDFDCMTIYKQKDIDHLQEAYNILQKDIKELEDEK